MVCISKKSDEETFDWNYPESEQTSHSPAQFPDLSPFQKSSRLQCTNQRNHVGFGRAEKRQSLCSGGCGGVGHLQQLLASSQQPLSSWRRQWPDGASQRFQRIPTASPPLLLEVEIYQVCPLTSSSSPDLMLSSKAGVSLWIPYRTLYARNTQTAGFPNRTLKDVNPFLSGPSYPVPFVHQLTGFSQVSTWLYSRPPTLSLS